MKSKTKKYLSLLIVFAMIISGNANAFAEMAGGLDILTSDGQETVTDDIYSPDTTSPVDPPVIPPIELPIVTEAGYFIEYIVSDTGEAVPGLDPINGIAAIGDVIEISHPEVKGFKVLDNQPTDLLIEEDESLNEVIVYYEMVPEVINKPYEISFLSTETKLQLIDSITGEAPLGEVIEIDFPEIKGYKLLDNQPTELLIEEDEELNKVEIYYELAIGIGTLVVNHHYYDNDVLTQKQDIIEELSIGLEINPRDYALDRKDIEFAVADPEILVISEEELNEIDLYYSPVIEEEYFEDNIITSPLSKNRSLSGFGIQSEPPGTIITSKSASWVDQENRIAKIEFKVRGIPLPQSGADVVLVLDRSGSMGMGSDKLDKTKEAANKFVEKLYEENDDGTPSNNRISLVTFSSSSTTEPWSGGQGGQGYFISATQNVGNLGAEDYLTGRITAMNANGGTNYDNAFTAAKNVINARSDDSRPTYIVFMSDGEPNNKPGWGNGRYDGQDIASQLKGTGTTIYSIGLNIGNSAFNNYILPLASGPTYAYNITNTNQLNPIFLEIASQIKIAGTNGVITDAIETDYFELIQYGGKTFEASYGTPEADVDSVVEWELNDITGVDKTLTIYIKLKDSVTDTGAYPTNKNAKLEYTDSEDNDQTIDYGPPELPYVGKNTVTFLPGTGGTLDG